MFALWANWHIQFVYGLFVLGVFACEPLLDCYAGYRLHAAREKLAAGEADLAGSGGQRAGDAAQSLRRGRSIRRFSSICGQTGAYNTISELRAMTFREPQHFVVLAAGAGRGDGDRLAPRCAAALADFSGGHVDAWRFGRCERCGFWRSLRCAVIAGGWNRRERETSRLPMPLRLRLAVAVCVLAVLAVSVTRYGVSNDWLEMQVAGSFPEGAARFVEQHHLGGPLLNDLSWGGFLIWRLPQLPVAIDGGPMSTGTIAFGNFRICGRASPDGLPILSWCGRTW